MASSRAEVVALHRRDREVEQHLVRERRAPQVVVELEGRRDAADRVREHDVLAVELAVDGVLAREAQVAGGVRQQALPDAAGVARRRACARSSASSQPGARSVYQELVTKRPSVVWYQ